MNTTPKDSPRYWSKLVTISTALAALALALVGVAATPPAVDGSAWDHLVDPDYLHVKAVAEAHSACANAHGRDANGWYVG